MNPTGPRDLDVTLKRWRDLNASAVPVRDQLVAGIRRHILDELDGWRQLPWVAAQRCRETNAALGIVDCPLSTLVSHGRWILDDDIHLDLASGGLHVYARHGHFDERDGDDLLVHLYDRDRDALDPYRVAETVRVAQPRSSSLNVDPGLVRRVAEGRLLPRWNCTVLCPRCDQADQNRTLVGLAHEWEGTFDELVDAAGLVLAP